MCSVYHCSAVLFQVSWILSGTRNTGLHIPQSYSLCIHAYDIIYVFLTDLLTIRRRRAPCDMGQIHLVKYRVAKRLGENNITEKLQCRIAKFKYLGVNILVSCMWIAFSSWTTWHLLLLSTCSNLDATTVWDIIVGHLFVCFRFSQPSNDGRQNSKSEESQCFPVGQS